MGIIKVYYSMFVIVICYLIKILCGVLLMFVVIVFVYGKVGLGVEFFFEVDLFFFLVKVCFYGDLLLNEKDCIMSDIE